MERDLIGLEGVISIKQGLSLEGHKYFKQAITHS